MVSTLFQEKLQVFQDLVKSTDEESVILIERYKALQFKEGSDEIEIRDFAIRGLESRRLKLFEHMAEVNRALTAEDETKIRRNFDRLSGLLTKIKAGRANWERVLNNLSSKV